MLQILQHPRIQGTNGGIIFIMVKRAQSSWLRILSVVFLAIFFFVLVGCGDNSQKTSGSDGDLGNQSDASVDDEPETEGDTKVIFYYNDGTDEIYLTTTYNSGKRVKKPADPVREGKGFAGWYAEAECTTEYSFTKTHEGEQHIYAKWLNQYTFEAEYTQLTGFEPNSDGANSDGEKIGSGYSNEVYGLNLIEKESSTNANSSNGYSIGNNFTMGFFLEFVIESDKEVNNAQLTLRLSCAYYSITLSDMEFSVSCRKEGVNIDDEANVQYFEFDDIVLETEFTDGYGDSRRRPFTNHFISNEVHLYEGKNIIRLEVTNNTKLGAGGTINTKAPMIDCIYVDTDANLTWKPHTENIAA